MPLFPFLVFFPVPAFVPFLSLSCSCLSSCLCSLSCACPHSCLYNVPVSFLDFSLSLRLSISLFLSPFFVFVMPLFFSGPCPLRCICSRSYLCKASVSFLVFVLIPVSIPFLFFVKPLSFFSGFHCWHCSPPES